MELWPHCSCHYFSVPYSLAAAWAQLLVGGELYWGWAAGNFTHAVATSPHHLHFLAIIQVQLEAAQPQLGSQMLEATPMLLLGNREHREVTIIEVQLPVAWSQSSLSLPKPSTGMARDKGYQLHRSDPVTACWIWLIGHMVLTPDLMQSIEECP